MTASSLVPLMRRDIDPEQGVKDFVNDNAGPNGPALMPVNSRDDQKRKVTPPPTVTGSISASSLTPLTL